MARQSLAWSGAVRRGKEGTACWSSPNCTPFSCVMRTNVLDADKGKREGAKLRELREGRGETQREVGNAVGVSRYMIIRLERGNFKRSTSTVVAKPADHFGVSVEEMLGESPDDLVPDVESMLRRAGRLDARDRVLLERIIRLMVEMQASRSD